MHKNKMIRMFVHDKIYKIAKMNEHSQKAVLANLRRGIGKKPGELPELWGSFLEDIPGDLMSQSGEPSKGEWAMYISITMFALHQQGKSLSSNNMNCSGISIGAAVRKLIPLGEEPQNSSVMKRFNQLITSSSMSEIAYYLRNIVQLLRASDIPLDYETLAEDLYEMQFPESSARVKLRWGQDFYRVKKEESNDKEEN